MLIEDVLTEIVILTQSTYSLEAQLSLYMKILIREGTTTIIENIRIATYTRLFFILMTMMTGGDDYDYD